MAKKARGAKKGTPFERKMCDVLSEWWCGNTIDRIFWRTAGSGAMATVRRRKGKNTGSHDGDLCAVHPSGKPFTDLLTVEMKKGYSSNSLHDLLDRPDTSKQKVIESFFEKARRQQQETKAFGWLVIHMRDSRKPLVYFPHRLMLQLVKVGAFPKAPTPFASIDTVFRTADRKKVRELVCVTTLSKFLQRVTPEHIRTLAHYLM